MKTSLIYLFAIVIMSMVAIFFNMWHVLGHTFIWFAKSYHALEALFRHLITGGEAAHRFINLLALVIAPMLMAGVVSLVLKAMKRYRPNFFAICSFVIWTFLMIVLSVSGAQ